MKQLFYLILFFPLIALAQSTDQNYIKTTTYKQLTATAIANPTAIQAQVGITYFDGLGRPMQQIAVGQSGTGNNIVTPITYDMYGRQAIEYLPIPTTNNSLNYTDNTQLTAGSNLYYDNNFGTDGAYRFSEKAFESSPLNRVFEQAAPGADWALGNGHTIKMEYHTNSGSDVKLYIATANYNSITQVYDVVISVGATPNYLPSTLYKSIVKDENWTSGLLNTTEVYKNKEGQVVLKRTYNQLDNGAVENYDTYYIYDQFGNLSLVVPPKAVDPLDSTTRNNLCYQYKYDSRNRLVEKKLPQKNWEFIVYDKLDRVVATGPVFSPFGSGVSGWSVTKYDAFSRPVLTGWYTNGVINSTSRKVLQGTYNGTVINLVKGSSTVDNIPVGYAATTLPSGFKLLTVNYYDDYAFPDGPTSTSFPTGSNNIYEVFYNNSDKKPKGMATGSWIRVLISESSTVGEKSYILYDKKGRPVKSYSTNHLNGYTSTETKLDFIGKPIFTVTKFMREAGSNPVELREDFTYDAQDRLLTHVHEIVGQMQPELLAQNEYDELGQLIKKNVGGNDISGAMSLQKVDYSYNIRGWLKEINNVDELSIEEPRDLFAFKINYNQPENTLGGQIEELYNGNISETLWKTDSDDLERSYGYQYDKLNRLSKANYQKLGYETGSYDETIQYDKNGNITGLQRNGYVDSDNQGMTYPIDDLIYTYDNNNMSNRLLSVYDASVSLDGFKDGNTSGNDYDYDDFGNMTQDLNKNIRTITYNHLNLPVITDLNTPERNNIKYLYNALGVKLGKTVVEQDGAIITQTDYLSGFQYLDDKLQFFPTAEGYVSVTDEEYYNYVYNYKDHLGNIRLSYTFEEQEQALRILEENHYYPFGLKHSYNTEHYDFKYDDNQNIFVVIEEVERNKFQYKYNGKEYQDELNLNLYDYGARNYDPALGRWMNIDPLAEKYFWTSPYNYVNNSPIASFDPDGMDVYFVNDKGEFTLALREKGKDRLYATTTDVLGITKIKDWFVTKGAEAGGGITIDTKGLLEQLTSFNKDAKYLMFSTTVNNVNNAEDDMLNLFHYVANNTNVEFSLNFYNKEGKALITLGTYQQQNFSPGPESYGIDFKSVTKKYHNHPRDASFTSDYTEEKSMGDLGKYKGGDALNAINKKVNFPNYVFFPKSTNLYNVTQYGIELIKKINNNAKNLKK